MAFDPDAYLAKKKTGTESTEKKASFDPDAYLASKGLGNKYEQRRANALGMVEAAANVASSAAAGLGGGLTYAASVPFVGNDAAQAMKSGVEQAFTYQPRGQEGQANVQAIAETLAPVGQALQDYQTQRGEETFARTGDASRATSEYMFPQVLIEAVGLLGGSGLTKALKLKSSGAKAKGEEFLRGADEELKIKEATEVIKKANPKDIAALIDADPKVLNAIDMLEIDADAPAAFYSRNPQYQAIEMGLASVDASELNLQQRAFLAEVAQKADSIISEYGGTKEKTAFSREIKDNMLKTADDTYQAESEIYKTIKQTLPEETGVNASNTLAYLERRATELGGIDKLSPAMRGLYNDLKPKQKKVGETFDYATGRKIAEYEETNPTFGLVNDRREQIGQQLGRKGDTPFKESKIGDLKGLYAAMKQDQSDIIVSSNDPRLLELQKAADIYTKQRKTIEADLKELIGKDLDNEIMIVVDAAVKGLPTKGSAQLISTINKIPKEYRQKAVLSAMNQAFAGTAASKQMLGEAQFAKYWGAINRDPELKKALFDNLPPESIEAIDNLGTLTTAIYKANQYNINSGKIIEFMNDRGGSIQRLSDRIIPSAAGFAASQSGGGAIAGAAVKTLLENSTTQAKAANTMLADQTFKRIIEQGVKDGVSLGKPTSPRTKRMEKEFAKSKKYQAWAETLEKADKDKIVAVGLVNYLISPKLEVIETQEEK